MAGPYQKIIEANLRRLYRTPTEQAARALPARIDGDGLVFEAFGEPCRIAPDSVFLGGRRETGVPGVLVSLYACHANTSPPVLSPLKSFKEMPDSMPYAGAFTTHAESPLIPHVAAIESAQPLIVNAVDGGPSPGQAGGDFGFLVRPLPKISLVYIFYRADDDFPASVTCLFSNNAADFMPTDGLADVGEYTSKKILTLLGPPPPA
ncbi:MAG: DUF3786 domain-containing protein [Desulfobacterales bacterium]